MQIKNRQQLLTIAAIAVLGLFAADKLIFDPLTNLWKTRARRVDQLRVQVAEGKALLKREPFIRGRWNQMQRNTLTNNTSAAEQQLFAAVDGWRQDSRVVINGATPQWRHDADDYMTYQCRMDASGSLSALSRFLYDIEKDPMALKLDSIELSARDKEGQQLVLSLQISGLVLTLQTR
ncbi:MAG TPA: hypothetical protein VL361_25490 [Candidatus Limnocylindrales bacterium]|nr:hypothetical protein [Candidatus Limnocylindrales bacterium]